MTRPRTASWSKLLILLGDGAGTENFTAPCGLTTKGINFSATAQESTVPDCDNPDLPAWTERVVTALSSSVSGSGLLALESLQTWRDWFLSGQPKNCRVKVDVPLAQNGGYFAGSFVCTRLNLAASQTGEGGKIRLESIELSNNGPVIWVAATA